MPPALPRRLFLSDSRASPFTSFSSQPECHSSRVPALVASEARTTNGEACVAPIPAALWVRLCFGIWSTTLVISMVPRKDELSAMKLEPNSHSPAGHQEQDCQ